MPIPAIIHQFWDRPDPPAEALERMQSWPKHHPGWRYIQWNDDAASTFIGDTFGKEAVQCFYAAKLPAMRSDITRIAAGLAMGGVYADVDFECIASLEGLQSEYGLLRWKPVGTTEKLKLANNFFAVSPRTELFEGRGKRCSTMSEPGSSACISRV